jgi:hypothetical protein
MLAWTVRGDIHFHQFSPGSRAAEERKDNRASASRKRKADEILEPRDDGKSAGKRARTVAADSVMELDHDDVDGDFEGDLDDLDEEGDVDLTEYKLAAPSKAAAATSEKKFAPISPSKAAAATSEKKVALSSPAAEAKRGGSGDGSGFGGGIGSSELLRSRSLDAIGRVEAGFGLAGVARPLDSRLTTVPSYFVFAVTSSFHQLLTLSAAARPLAR